MDYKSRHKIIKSRVEFYCGLCNDWKTAGRYKVILFCGQYCLKCGIEKANRLGKTVKIKEILKDYEKNKEKYESEDLVVEIGGD